MLVGTMMVIHVAHCKYQMGGQSYWTNIHNTNKYDIYVHTDTYELTRLKISRKNV